MNDYNNDFGVDRVFSSTGLFSMEAPTKIYSSTGLFSTDETRMYGKWGRRLLTGAALLGGAALANHALGDPWGIGAKVADTAKGAWNVFTNKTANANAVAAGANNAYTQAQKNAQAKKILESTAAATAKAGGDAMKNIQGWKAWIAKAEGEVQLWHSTYSKKAFPQGTGATPKAFAGADVFKQRVDALIQEANSMQKPPASGVKENQMLNANAWKSVFRDSNSSLGSAYQSGDLGRVFYALLNELNTISQTVAQCIQSGNTAGGNPLDDNELQKFVPLSQELLNAYQKQWETIQNGSTTVEPLELANNIKPSLDQIKGKYDRAKKNGWAKSASAYAKIYNTLSEIYGKVAEAALYRQGKA